MYGVVNWGFLLCGNFIYCGSSGHKYISRGFIFDWEMDLKTCLFLQFYSSWGGISPDVSSQTWNLCRFCFHAYGFRDMRLFSYLYGFQWNWGWLVFLRMCRFILGCRSVDFVVLCIPVDLVSIWFWPWSMSVLLILTQSVFIDVKLVMMLCRFTLIG